MPTEMTFRALYATRENGAFDASFRDLDRTALPAGEVLIRVAYSSVNYKDGLAVLGKPGVIRTFPMILGIDLAGVVEEVGEPGSEAGRSRGGHRMRHVGDHVGWSTRQLARLDAQYVVPVPETMSLQQAMAIGTAGFTAIQSVVELERHGLTPGDREVLVTGAAGGVGSAAVAILAHLG